jgi:hypothetical protein
MPLKSVIMDAAKGTGQYAGVSPIGEVTIAGFGTLTNQTVFQSFAPATQANFFGPIAGQQFVITSIAADGNNTNVVIFEAANPFTSTIDKTLFQIHLQANANIVIPLPFGGFLPVTEGEYLNATNSAGTTNVTITGYYISIKNNEA